MKRYKSIPLLFHFKIIVYTTLFNNKMSIVLKLKDGIFMETNTWRSVSNPNSPITNTLYVPGMNGVSNMDIYITKTNQAISYYKKKWRQTSLWLVGFQRVNKRIKMCDVIWLMAGEPVVQSIDKTYVEKICEYVSCNVYMCGLDPLPWKKFYKDAQRYGWKQEDWHHLLSEDSEEDDDDSNDSDWNPEDSEEEEEEEY